MQVPLGAFWTAVLYGAFLAASLVIGALIAAGVRLPRRVIGSSLAFASGALISAIALELIFVPYTQVGVIPVLAGAAAGAVVFAVIDLILDHTIGRGGWGIVLEQTTEGVPESLAVGATAGTAGFGLFAAIFISNIPEAMSGGFDLIKQRPRKQMVLAWTATGAALFSAALAGYAMGRFVGEGPTSVLHAAAGGAALAGVSSEMMPEAYTDAGLGVTLATVAGFLVAFGLFTLSYEPSRG